MYFIYTQDFFEVGGFHYDSQVKVFYKVVCEIFSRSSVFVLHLHLFDYRRIFLPPLPLLLSLTLFSCHKLLFETAPCPGRSLTLDVLIYA